MADVKWRTRFLGEFERFAQACGVSVDASADMNEERNLKRAEVALAASQARLEQARSNLAIAERTLETEKRRSAAALTSAEARAQDSRGKAARAKRLWEKSLASREECETAETAAVAAEADLENARLGMEELKTQELALDVKRQDIRRAQAQVDSDRIVLADARQRLRETKVHAPISGVVSARNVEIGQIVSSGINNIAGGTTLLTVSDLSRAFVLADVDESDIGKVRVAQEARITADAYPNETFGGRVARIATRGVSTSDVVTFEVKVEVLGANRTLLKPEMTANVEIVAAMRNEALLVPIGAVFRRGKSRMALVAGHVDGIEERAVEVGITDGAKIEVTRGLSEGESVIADSGAASGRWSKEDELGPRHGPPIFRRRSGGRK